MTPAFHTFHFSPFVGADVPLLDVLEATRAAGFTHTGLDVASIEAHVVRGGSLEDVTRALRDLELSVTDVLHLPITADERANADHATTVAAHAQRVGAPWCLTAVPAPLGAEQLTRSLRAAAARMTDMGSRMALEFCSHLHLRTLADAMVLCDDIGRDRCGIVLDSLHFDRTGADWELLARVEASQIAFVQLSDARRRPSVPLAEESRDLRMLPGDGELPLARFLDVVRGTGFDGVVVAEVLSTALRRESVGTAAQLVHDAMVAVLGQATPPSAR